MNVAQQETQPPTYKDWQALDSSQVGTYLAYAAAALVAWWLLKR